jgi:hypothetical protein
MAFVAVALIAGLWEVARFVYGTGLAWCLTLPVVVLVLACWVALPLSLRRRRPFRD